MKKKKKALAGAVLLLKSGWGRSLLLAAAIILALAGAAMLRMKEWSQITEDGYVVTEEVADTLKNGMEDPEAEYVDLYPVSAWDGVYSRLGSLYVGEDLQRFLQAYPQILGSGSGVRFLTDSMELIAEDMTTRLSTYDGLRMNGGITFNEDGSQADVENFVLVGLPNGLYLNARNMELSYASVSTVVPADSIVYFGESEVRCYVRRESELVYQEIGSLMAARIRIGNLDMDYRDFLELLESSSGSGVDVPREEPARWEEIQAVESVVIDSQGGTGGHTEQGGREEGGADSEDQAGTQGSGSASSASQDGAQAGQGSQAGASQDGASAGTDGSADGSSGDGGSGSGSGGNADGTSGDQDSSRHPEGGSGSSGESSDAVAEPGGETGEEDGDIVDGGELDLGDHVPEVTSGDFRAEVYHIYSDVTLDDEYGQLYKLTYKLYWGGDLQTIRMRKSVRSSQVNEDGKLDIDLSLVPPGSKVRIEATYTYYDSNGEKIEKDFLPEGGVTVETMTLEEGLEAGLIDRIGVSFDSGAEIVPRLTNQLQLPELKLEVSDIMQEYLYRTAVHAQKQGTDDFLDIPFSSSDLRKLKRGEGVSWVSENTVANTDFLSSDTVFDCGILIQDKFGNSLPLKRLDGTGTADMEAYLSAVAGTAKRAPSVTVTEKRVTDPDAETIGTKQLTLKLTNPDGAPLLTEQVTTSEGTVGRKLYLRVFALKAGEETPMAIDMVANGHLDTLYDGTFIVLDPEAMQESGGQELVINNLPADRSTSYSFRIYGNYNLTPENDLGLTPEEDVWNASVGTYQSASMAITRLGYAFASLEAEAADTTAVVRGGLTNSTGEALRDLFTRFEIQLLEGNASSVRGGVEKYTAQLRKEDFYENGSARTFPDSGTYTLCRESGKYTVTVQGTAGEEIWKTLCYGAQLTISYENLNSTLYYQTKLSAFVEQGYTGQGTMEHDVSGSSNTCTFRMLKLTPKVSRTNFYTVSDFIEIRGLQIYDKDGVITGTSSDINTGTSGNVIVQLQTRNGSDWQTTQSRVVNTTADPNQRLDNIRFQGLGRDQEYRVRFVAVSYNTTWSAINEQASRVLDVAEAEWTLTTGTGVTSSLALLGASEALNLVEGSVDSLNLIETDQVQKGYVDNPDGTLAVNSGWWTTGFIPVEEGDILMFYRVSRTNGAPYLAFYKEADEESALMLTGGTTSARRILYTSTYESNYAEAYGTMDYNLIPVPEGAKYIRLSSVTNVIYQAGPNSSKLLSLKQMGMLDGNSGESLFNGGALSWDKADIKTGYAFNKSGKTEVVNGSYSLTGRISVTPGEYYMALGGHPTNAGYVGFYNEEDAVIDVLDNLHSGFRFQAPEGASYMRLADTPAAVDGSNKLIELTVRHLNRNMLDSGQILQADEGGNFYANVRADVSDPGGDLKVNPADQSSEVRRFVMRWYQREGIDGADTSDKLVYEDTVSFDGTSYRGTHQKELDGYCSYCVTIWADLYGEEILLSDLYFTTEEVTYSIACDEDLDLLNMFPYGKFTVVEDFTTARTGVVTSNFYGKIDGQGHTITNAGQMYLISNLRDGAEISNLIINWDTDLNSGLRDRSALISDNYGTLRNIIVRINLSGAFPNVQTGGIVRMNRPSGLIENFAVLYENDLTANRYWGGICGYNQGTVQNGYAYISSSARVNFASAQYLGNSANVVYDNGVIVGHNYAEGTVRNVYTVGDINVEKQNTNSYTGRNGLAVGYSLGTVQNVLTRGDRYAYTISSTTNVQGPSTLFAASGGISVGMHAGSWREEDVYYISPQGAVYPYTNQTAAEDSDLWNVAVMSNLLNGDGQFQVEEMIPSGYYPKILMNDVMLEAQPAIPLPSGVGLSAPEVLDARPVEEGTDENGQDYVIASIRFINNRQRQITELVLDGLDCEILSQQMGQDYYEVTVKLTNPQYCHSSYELKSFSYRASAIGDATRTESFGAGTPNGEKYLDIEFWRKIRTTAEWNRYLSADQIDMIGNYEIAADLDFAGMSGSQTAELGRKNLGGGEYQAFSGAVRGAQVSDGAGGTRPASIRNYPAEKGYVIESMDGGRVENLLVENISFEGAPAAQASRGFLAQASGSELSHVRMEGVSMPGAAGSAGALAGTLTECTVEYCSASDVEMESADSEQGGTLILGGLLGSAERSTVQRCFVSGLTMTARAGSAAGGIGGLAGCLTGNGGKLQECYAQGSIDSSFSGTGGLVGIGGNNISQVWTDVSVRSSASGIGGILGSAESSLSLKSAFAAGEVYSQTGSLDNVGRLYGNELGSAVVTASRVYAYEGQLMNGQSVTDRLDALALLASEDLSGSSVRAGWSRRLGLGSGWQIQGADSPEETPGMLPWLLDEDGATPLPGQSVTILRDLSLELNPVGYVIQSGGEYPYKLYVSFVQPIADTLYEYGSTVIEGMEAADPSDAYPLKLNTQTSVADGTVTTSFELYTRLNSYQDNYRVTVQVKRADGSVQSLSGVLQFAEEDVPYLEISNIDEWKHYLGSGSGELGLGQSYQNIAITGTVDFSSLSNAELSGYLSIRAGKLKGAGSEADPAMLTGLDYTARKSGEAVFSDITGAASDITFKNMKLDVSAYGGTNVGLINRLQGNGSGLVFENVTVDAGTASQVGCIGITEGSLDNIRLDNIRITARGDYVGGLTGTVRGSLTNIVLEGTDTDYDRAADTTTYGSQVTVEGSYSNTGGICGIGYGLFADIQVTGTSVRGRTQVGGVSGLSNQGVNERITVGALGYQDKDGETVPYAVEVAASGSSNYAAGVNGFIQVSSYNATVNHYEEVQVLNTYVSAGNYAGGIGTNATYAEHCLVDGCYIYASGSYAGGISATWSTVNDSIIRNSHIQAGNERAGGGGGYAVAVLNSTFYKNTVIAGSYAGGVLGMSYDKEIRNCSVTDCYIGSENANYAGGLLGGQVSDTTSDRYVLIYNSFSKDTTVTANIGAGGIVGKAMGSRFQELYSNATVVARERAGGFAGEGIGYMMNNTAYRRMDLKHFYFAGSVKATSTYAGGLFGYYSPGEQERNSDGSFYLGEALPVRFNDPTLDESGNTLDSSTYFEGIVIASQSVYSNTSSTQAVVANHVSEKGYPETGTAAGEIPKLYIWDDANPDNQSRLGSQKVTSSELATEAFWIDAGFAGTYWNFLGLGEGAAADAAILPQGTPGTLLLNTEELTDGKQYEVEVMADTYVQNEDLVLWLDALNNTGEGWDPDAAYWTNLASEDGESYQLRNFAEGSWKSNGLYFAGGSQYLDTVDNGTLGSQKRKDNQGREYTAATISFMLKLDDGNYAKDNYLLYGRSTTQGGFLLRFYNTGRTYLWVDNSDILRNGTGTDLPNGWTSGYPALYKADSGKNIADKYVQLTLVIRTYLQDTGNRVETDIYLDEEKFGTISQTGGFESRYGNLLRLGVGSSTDTYGSIKGTLGSVMAYDCALTEAEIAQNSRVNHLRYDTGSGRVNGADSSGSTSVKKSITVTGGETELKLMETELESLGIKEAEQEGRQLYVRIKQDDGSYLGAGVTWPLGIHAPAVKSTAYRDKEETTLAPDVDENASAGTGGTVSATGSGWDFDNMPYVKVKADNSSALSNITYQWYSSHLGGYDGTPIEGENSDTLRLTGNGYYYCRVTATESYTEAGTGAIKERTVYGYSKVYRHSTEGYMPYVRGRNTPRLTLPAQEGLYEVDGALYPYSTTDSVYSGGVPLPGSGAGTFSLMRALWLGGRASEPAPAVRAYASGANLLNLEFDSNIPYRDDTYLGGCWFTVEADGADVALTQEEGANTALTQEYGAAKGLIPVSFTDEEGRQRTGYYIDERVYTLRYDFQTELTVTTWSEFYDAVSGESYLDSQTCQVTPEETARRVVTWDDEYAYINNKDMLNGSMGRIECEGGFVNLYGAEALTADGRLLDLRQAAEAAEEAEAAKAAEGAGSEEPDGGGTDSAGEAYVSEGETSGSAGGTAGSSGEAAGDSILQDLVYEDAGSSFTVLSMSNPLFTGSYGEFGIETYAGFTCTTRGEERYTSSRQLFVKNGQLFTSGTLSADSLPVQDGYILDTYQDYRYLTVLNAGGKRDLEDLEQPVHYPSGFANYNISHISNTLENSEDSHIVMGCYEHGGIWGFNYFTGEWLDLDSDADTTNFAAYLLGTVRARFFNTVPRANDAYEQALDLETNIGVYLLENGDELPAGAVSGYGDTVDDGSLLSLEQEYAAETDLTGVTNANGDVAEPGDPTQEEGSALAADPENTAVAGEDRAKADPESDDSSSGVIHQRPEEETETFLAEGEPGELAGFTGGWDAEEPEAPEPGTPADEEGPEVSGGRTEEYDDPEELTDGVSEADGTAKGQNEGGTTPGGELVTVYDASSGSYGVYDAEDLLTASDEELMTMDAKLAGLGVDMTVVRIDNSRNLTEQEQWGMEILLAVSGGVLVLLGGLLYVHHRKVKIRR